MFPDPARAREVLAAEPPIFHHITLKSLSAPQAEGFGHEYIFTLPSGAPVQEFVVPLASLTAMLEAQGFEVGPLRSAQEHVTQTSEEFLKPFLQGQFVTQKDWHSLGFFATLWARKLEPGQIL
jgi:hypothetical protein